MPETGGTLSGTIFGGQQAIIGAHVFVLAANTTGYPTASTNASVSLLTTGDGQNSAMATALPGAYYVTSTTNGTFSLTGKYTCTPGQQLYLYAVGGYSDTNPSDVNSGIGIMAVLGNCPSGGASTFSNITVAMNEVTTVAAGYAFAGFAYDATHVSSPSTPLALQGIRNAFANAADLASITTGGAMAVTPTNPNAVVPQAQIYTEANILAACVNTTSSSSTNCNTLFSNSLSGGATGTQPTDTATAIINIAHHPYVSSTVMSNLFGLQAATAAPYSSDLTAQPTDWTMPISITSSAGASYVAIDPAGNAWVSSPDVLNIFTPNGAVATTSNSSLAVNSPLSGNGMNGNFVIAFDTLGNAWVGNDVTNSATISVFTSTGAAATTSNSALSTNSPLSPTGLSQPTGIAFDASGNAWVANKIDNNIVVFTSSGGAAAFSPISGNGLNLPFAVAIDTSGNAWVANYNSGANDISVFTSAGVAATTTNSALTTNSPLTGNQMDRSDGIAIDPSGNAWVANSYATLASYISGFQPNGSVAAASPINTTTSSTVSWTLGIAIDGAGNIWTGSEIASMSTHPDQTMIGSVCEWTSSGTALAPQYGFQNSDYEPWGLAVDGSGDVWVVGNSITLYIGAATPVVTPIVANLKAPYGAAAVNKP